MSNEIETISVMITGIGGPLVSPRRQEIPLVGYQTHTTLIYTRTDSNNNILEILAWRAGPPPNTEIGLSSAGQAIGAAIGTNDYGNLIATRVKPYQPGHVDWPIAGDEPSSSTFYPREVLATANDGTLSLRSRFMTLNQLTDIINDANIPYKEASSNSNATAALGLDYLNINLLKLPVDPKTGKEANALGWGRTLYGDAGPLDYGIPPPINSDGSYTVAIGNTTYIYNKPDGFTEIIDGEGLSFSYKTTSSGSYKFATAIERDSFGNLTKKTETNAWDRSGTVNIETTYYKDNSIIGTKSIDYVGKYFDKYFEVLSINGYNIQFKMDADDKITPFKVTMINGHEIPPDRQAEIADALANSGMTISAEILLAPPVSLKNILDNYDPVALPQTTGPTTDILQLETTTDPATANQPQTGDANSQGPSANNGLESNGNYQAGIDIIQWDVNRAGSNEAIAGYEVTQGVRPGNHTLVPLVPILPLIQNTINSGDSSLNGGLLNNSASGVNTTVPVDPLVLDLDGGGVSLTSFGDAPVQFDIDNDGTTQFNGSKELTGWVASGEGIVVQDLNNNGKIDGIAETLSEYYNGSAGGSSAPGTPGQKRFTDGFAALKSLDSNADQQFTSADAAWNSLRVWVDANHNGQTDAGELKTFEQLGITSINLNAQAQSGLVNGGNQVLASGTFVQNGATKEAISANFIANPAGASASTVSTGGVAGTVVATEGSTINGQNVAASKAYVSQNTNATLAETLNASTLGVNNIQAGAGNDSLIGTASANWLVGGKGNDKFDAGAGDDVLLIDADDAQSGIHAGAGFDLVQVIDTYTTDSSHAARGVTFNLAQAEAEMAIGGAGNDVLIGGGRQSVFIRAGDGDDIVIGGAANDALSGENDNDLLDGGAGNDLLRGGRGQDQILGGVGDDVLDGGLDDDVLNGGAGNDVLIGGGGDDQIDGGDGIDVVQFSGSYADYRITKVADINGSITWRVVDTTNGRDGADTLKNIEKLSFKDVNSLDLKVNASLPVKDIIAVADHSGIKTINVSDLLANDRDLNGDVLHITSVGEAKAGRIVGALLATGIVLKARTDSDGNQSFWSFDQTSFDAKKASLGAQASSESLAAAQAAAWGTQYSLAIGDQIQFEADGSTHLMGFKYRIADSANNATQVTNTGTGQTAPLQAAVILRTADLPSDPLLVEQWYLDDTNVLAAWGTTQEQAKGQGYSGKGIRIGQFEPGGPYSVGPEVFDYRHPDLSANADKAWLNTLDANGNNNAPQTFSNHATQVAGVIVAARNGEGGVGVAYNASLAGNYFPGEGLAIAQITQGVRDALAQFKNYDVVNNSWGATANFQINVLPTGTLETGILDAIRNGRYGLGTAIVMAGGNSRATGANTNTNALTANRAVITTGSINAPGDLGLLQIGSKPFSNPGASILVSAPGSNIDSTSRALIADNGSTFGSAYDVSQGTSFAAPIVSGVIALMLEANPNLGYRDIQSILALSATKVDDPNGTDWTFNTAKNWNGGGLHTSHDYGFGKVDARAAVRLAETWFDQSTIYNEQSRSVSSATLNASIPDGVGVYSNSVTAAAGLEVESAQVTLQLDHQRWGDLIIKLISPSGTESILVNRPGKAPGSAASDLGDATNGSLNFSFNTTHVRGEQSAGNWTLQVIDAASGNVGTIKNWTLNLYGATADSDDLYVYTNEFATTTGRGTLTDTNGGVDILNASAVTGDSTINLNNGSTSTIAGKTLIVNGDIEKAYGGDGNDNVIGNAQSNVLLGGRGNDALSGGAGRDRLEGGIGNDSFTGGADNDLFVIRRDAGSTDTITDFNAASGVEKIVIAGFDSVTDFTQLSLLQVGANVQIGLGQGQSVIVNNTTLAQLSEQNFVFVTNPTILENYARRWGNAAVWTGSAGVENTLLPNNYGDLNANGLGGDDVLGSQTTHDLIDGGNGNDTIWGDYPGYSPKPGDDWLEGGAGNDVLRGGLGNDTLSGGSGNDVLQGEDGNDYLIGSTGQDYLEGGNGNDLITLDGDVGTVNGSVFGYYGTRVGGSGADVFKVLANGGGVSGFSASGSQFVASNLIADFDPAQNGEKIDISSFAGITRLADLRLQNLVVNGVQFLQITATNGAQSLNLTLRGVSAAQLNATHFVFAPGTPGAIIGTNAATPFTLDQSGNAIVISDGANNIATQVGENASFFNSHAGTIISGVDLLPSITKPGSPPPGNIQAGAAELGLASLSTTASAEVAQIGSDSVANNTATSSTTHATQSAVTGVAGDDILTGDAGANYIDGLSGADTMTGRTGDDTYVVDNIGDAVVELPGGGYDTVQSSVNYSLSNDVENLVLTGTGNLNGTGNAQQNRLLGNAGNNRLDGGADADMLLGGAGNDTYVVDNQLDSVLEKAGEGIDAIEASVSWTLSANVENLTLTGNSNINGTGNELANIITGNAADNILDGQQGADALIGGLGNDTYYVDNVGDSVSEAANAGIDSIYTSINLTLNANVENGILAGSATTLTGNELDNTLTGNALANTLSGGAGSDVLDGGAGADTLVGGAGDDVYFVENTGDVVQEQANQGIDTVVSTINFDLSTRPDVENVLLSGTANLVATGNAQDNRLTGNAGANTLNGGAGNDTLDGGSGDDMLDGGIGDDNYIHALGDGKDSIVDASGTDTLTFGSGISANQIVATRVNGNVVLTVGTGDSVQFAQTGVGSFAVETIRFADGSQWNAATLAQKLNTAPTGTVTITGVLEQGSTVTAVNNISDADGIGPISYTWHKKISIYDSVFGTTATVTLPSLDNLSYAVYVVASYTDGLGKAESVVSQIIRPALPGDPYPPPPTTETSLTADANDQLTSSIRQASFLPDRFNRIVKPSYEDVIGQDNRLYFDNAESDTISDLYRHTALLAPQSSQISIDSTVHSLVQAMAAFAPPAAIETTLRNDYHNQLTPGLAANWQ
jgi:Ca2+-binding RTX toxin-like protein